MHEVKDGKLTMSTGVVFKVEDVSLFAFNKINQKMEAERPKVPMIYIEGKNREEANPSDPDYIAAIESFDRKLTEKILDMVIVLGTEVISVPDGFPKAEDEGWARKLQMLDFDIPEDGEDRYLAWVKLCAIRTTDDFTSLTLACARSAGVTEEDVAEAAGSFPGSTER